MFTYPMVDERRTARHSRRTGDGKLHIAPQPGIAVTMLDESLRSCIDAANDGSVRAIHATTVKEAFAAVQRYSPQLLLISSSAVFENAASMISSLILRAPGANVVAVLGSDWITAQRALLELGACGVRSVVNLAEREGWNSLRALMQDAGSEMVLHLLTALLPLWGDARPEAQQFFGTMIRVAPEIATVGALARTVGLLPSSLMSRFFRAGLPSPKIYLATTRVCYAAHLLENPSVSFSSVANHLHCSSPQSFARYVRSTFGIPVSEFRRKYRLAQMIARFREQLIGPYAQTLRRFQPFGSCPGGRVQDSEVCSEVRAV